MRPLQSQLMVNTLMQILFDTTESVIFYNRVVAVKNITSCEIVISCLQLSHCNYEAANKLLLITHSIFL